jgi:predicted transcriptional regulator
MKKNAPLTFRVSSDLKKNLQRIADREARSTSQICELLLAIGVEAYEEEGARYLQRVLNNLKES